MAFLSDLSVSALPGGTAEEKLDSLVRQLNEWGREISNENITKVYRANLTSDAIYLGLAPDGTNGITITSNGITVAQITRSGVYLYDDEGNLMTLLDTKGLTTIEASTGDYKNRVGIATDDGRTGIWTAEDGVDLQDLGI